MLADVNDWSALSYSEVRAIVENNGEPFTTSDQCDLFLRAVTVLRGRQPAESEQEGNRVLMRDVELQIVEARRMRGIFRVAVDLPTAIVPSCDLR